MTSMHRRRFAAVGRPCHAVTLGAQLLKDLQHRFFGRIDESPLGHVCGVPQQLFGFSDFFHAASVGGPACNRTQLFLKKVVSP